MRCRWSRRSAAGRSADSWGGARPREYAPVCSSAHGRPRCWYAGSSPSAALGSRSPGQARTRQCGRAHRRALRRRSRRAPGHLPPRVGDRAAAAGGVGPQRRLRRHQDELAGYFKLLASDGFAVAAPRYSLAPRHHHPTPLRQLVQALQYLQANAGRLLIDPGRIALAGDSAGAHIAAQASALVTTAGYADTVGINPAITSRATPRCHPGLRPVRPGAGPPRELAGRPPVGADRASGVLGHAALLRRPRVRGVVGHRPCQCGVPACAHHRWQCRPATAPL